jgi:hypothetical protein
MSSAFLFNFTVTPVGRRRRAGNDVVLHRGRHRDVVKTGTLSFAPSETTKTITIEVKGDTKKEANETFYLDLFGLSSNALFTKNRGIGTILNDD